MFTRQILLAAALLGALLVAPGADARGKKFSCPMPNGTTCKSVEEIYQSTNDKDHLSTVGVSNPTQTVAAPSPLPPIPVAGSKVPTSTRCCDPVRTDVTVVGDTLAVASPGPGYTGYQQGGPVVHTAAMPVTNTVAVAVPRSDAYRQPAKVMRIFINPWEDEAGDLHMGGYVLTEVEPRRWSVGVQAPSMSDTFRLVTQSPVRETAQDASPSADSATSADGRAGNTVASSNNN